MSGYDSGKWGFLRDQVPDNYTAGGHHRQQATPDNSRQIQSHYHKDDYEARARRNHNARWSDNRPRAHGGSGYDRGYDASYTQQQYYGGDQSDYEHRFRRGGHGYGYCRETIYPPASVYDTYDYQNCASNYGFHWENRCAIAPVGDPSPPSPSPSPSYLSNSLSPSRRVDHPPRKLLILDLNGALLFRSRPPFQPPPTQLPPKAADDSSLPSIPPTPIPFQRLQRTVYARPYLPSFREYLFHTSTRCWLDVMIWSSAQPHSVQAMLQTCFPAPVKPPNKGGDEETCDDAKPDGRFIAVWARDTLGLSRLDYVRKSQTTKDLHKAWSQLQPVSGHNIVTGETSSAGEPSETYLFRHSAMTTLLLDDSPQKAYLQPWNHVCVREYDAAARKQDLKVLLDTRQKTETGHIGGRSSVDEPQPLAVETSSIVPSRTRESPGPLARFRDSFDPTLLAIIGILEAIKHESNVAGWIRARGLWVEGHPDILTKHKPQQVDKTESHPACHFLSGTEHSRDLDKYDNALNTLAKQRPEKRRRLHTLPRPVMENSAMTSQLSDHSPSSIASVSSVKLPWGRASPIEMDAKYRIEKDVGNAVHCISSEDEKNVSMELPTFWFSHAPTFTHWVSEGRDALARLGIAENHGVSAEEP